MSELANRKVTCPMTEPIHKIDKRILVLENEVPHIKSVVHENRAKLANIDSKVDDIVTHIAKQNGALPRIEKNVELALTQIQSHSDEEKKEIKAKITNRQKAFWATASAAITGGLLLILKFALGVL